MARGPYGSRARRKRAVGRPVGAPDALALPEWAPIPDARPHPPRSPPGPPHVARRRFRPAPSRPAARRRARAVRQPRDADDLVQEIYLTLLRRPRRLTRRLRLAYLMTMLRNRFIDAAAPRRAARPSAGRRRRAGGPARGPAARPRRRAPRGARRGTRARRRRSARRSSPSTCSGSPTRRRPGAGRAGRDRDVAARARARARDRARAVEPRPSARGVAADRVRAAMEVLTEFDRDRIAPCWRATSSSGST